MNRDGGYSCLIIDFHQLRFLTIGVEAVFKFFEQVKGFLEKDIGLLIH
ncbi:Uncharacterised protein [Mycobacterium tuberculosis]|nr:Uncharacterised protein [Streptococcus pneumoniae]CKV09406.1 Uncharacterised protein [Mycobacterium tuberculosis]